MVVVVLVVAVGCGWGFVLLQIVSRLYVFLVAEKLPDFLSCIASLASFSCCSVVTGAWL